ncbi:MAG: ABC transporter permease [Bacteroidetes bacterium]|nr:ABC transporter permease [Bacteroidota bacterium]
MYRNYFKIAIRQILKHKLFSALNIFGLAVSMAVCLLVIMILTDQFSYDSFHENGDRIYRVISDRQEQDVPLSEPRMATTSLRLGEVLPEQYPFVEKTTRIVGVGGVFEYEGKRLTTEDNGYLVDSDFLDMFSFGWIKGDKKTALAKPRTIVLTKKTADTFFPDSDPIGKVISFEDVGEYEVTGLLPDPPMRSHIRFEFLISYETVVASSKEEREKLSIYGYDNVWRGLVYAQLKEGTPVSEFQKACQEQAAAFSERDELHHYLFEPQALSDVLPSRDLGNEIGVGTPMMVLWFVLALGIIIILAACFNYMNLSVARSLKRAKEIGIRKVAGAGKRDIMIQFLGEAMLISLLSLGVALCILEFLIPAFYGLDPFIEDVFHLERTPQIYLTFLGFALVIGFLAGIFPAFNISKFQPIQSIQQLSKVKVFSRIGMRKALVTAQFGLSLIFILTVIIVLNQQKYVLEADLGVNIDNMMNVWMHDGVDFEVFSEEVKKLSGVEDVSAANNAILLGGNYHELAKFNNQMDSVQLSVNHVSQNYIPNLEIELIAGTNFPENGNSKGEQFLILNEKAVQRMGYNKPYEALGQTVYFDTLGLSVIGVVKDFHHDNIWFSPIEPYAMRNGELYKNCVNIHLSDASNSSTIDNIHEVWNTVSPNKDINASFTDTRVYYMSKFFRMGSKILSFVGFLTILISCLGLLGMVIYTIEGKLKEVGIRKILGASEGNIHWQLAKGFFFLLIIAILFALPVTIFLGNMWLQNFVIRISISPAMILTGIGIILLLALLTVISQTHLAARTNPVNILRSE